VFYPGGNRLELRILQSLDNLVRADLRREVDVIDRQPQQLVADSAAYVARKSFTGSKGVDNCRHTEPASPLSRIQLFQFSRRARLTRIAAVAPQIRLPPHSITQ